MRKNIPSQFQDTDRQIMALASIGQDHPQWSEFPSQETLPAAITQSAYDFDASPYKQYAFLTGQNNLYVSSFTLSSGATQITRTFQNFIGVNAPISEDYRAVAAGAGCVYCALNGGVYFVNQNNMTWVLLADLTDQAQSITPIISLCAADKNTVVAAAVYASNKVYDHCKLSVITHTDTGGSVVVDTWKGFLPKHATKPGLAAIKDSAGTIYIYVDDWSGKKPVYIRRFEQGIWSATREILPTDALDEDSCFKVGYASKTSGSSGTRLILTGTLKRAYGPSYAIYMVGPEKFTFGRDLIIKSGYDKLLKLVSTGSDDIWAVGESDIYRSTAQASIFGAPNFGLPSQIYSFNLDTAVNQGDRLSLELPKSTYDSLKYDIVPGAQVNVSVLSNGANAEIGHFGIDRVRNSERGDGESYELDCTSYAMKKLLDWESDTYFDYMGQGEVHGNPGDLTKLVGITGQKWDRTNGLKIFSLNDSGFLYTVPAASHGGFIKCKFTNVQTTSTMIGVGLNYGEETLAEAAERLGKKIENVTAGERGRWALLAVYNPDPFLGQAGKGKITLIDYNTNRIGNTEDPNISHPYLEITSVWVDRPAAGGTAILAMQYQDGYARVYYGNQSTPDLKLVISSITNWNWELHKVEHGNYGRGMLYLRNNTGFHLAYPFMSDSDVIPLHSSFEKAQYYGQPIEDRIDKFPASGTVVVDSEYIQYSGIAGVGQVGGADNRTSSLDWLPGEILCQAGDGANTPAGTPANFAQTRGTTTGTHYHGNNYLLQMLPNSIRGKYLTAVRVWLKKVNYPEDGVTLTINAGNVGSSASAVALVNNVKIYGSQYGQITAAGGWVTFWIDDFYLDTSTEYWIMIRRNKNPNHPSSSAYFQYMRMADNTILNAGAYVFCEEDDQAVGQGGDMAFLAYGKVEGPNKEFCLTTKYYVGSGIPASDPGQNYFNNQAIAITEGPGKNNCYKVVRTMRYTSGVNDLYLIYIDRNPGRIFDIGTKLKIVPALYGLTRGRTDLSGNATSAAAHGDKAMVNLPTNAFASAADFEYYTADEDLTLAEVAEDLARKAGVLVTDKCNRHSGTVSNSSTYEYLPAQSKNLIVTMQIPKLALHDSVAVVFYDDQDRECMSANLDVQAGAPGVYSGWLTFYSMDWVFDAGLGYWMEYSNHVLSLPFDDAVKGDFRLSLYDGHMAVWCGGRLLGATRYPDLYLKAWKTFRVSVYVASGLPVSVMIPQAGTRVDNFVMDMGKTGAQLMTSLIGEKRVYYRDTGDTQLKIYTDRETVPGAYNRAVSRNTELTDIGLATRVLLEGGEVVEVSSDGNLAQYGNFFKTFNFSEINNLDDANYFAGLVLEDMTLNRERVEIEGAADLRIEPTDIIAITQKDGSTREAVVDTVSQQMRIDESEAIYDMRLSGRYR